MATKEVRALEWAHYGRNIQAAAGNDGFVYLRVKVDAAAVAAAPMAKGTPEKPGKNHLLASTGGNISLMVDGVPAGLKLGMNVMFPPTGKAPA
jgi:hypothetical protein